MKKYICSVKMCLMRSLVSWRFLISVLLTSALFLLDLLPHFLSGIVVLDGTTYYGYSLIELFELSGGTMFLGFSFITVVIPASGMFCDDLDHHFVFQHVKRSSVKGYVSGHAVACGVSAFLTVAISEIVCLSVYAIFLPLTSEHIMGNSQYSLLNGGHFILFLMAKVLLFSLRGSFFALVSLMISAVVNNKYVVFSAPFVLYFFLMKFGYSILNVPGQLNILGIYFYFPLGDDAELLSLLYVFMVTLVTGILAGSAVSYKIRRCL